MPILSESEALQILDEFQALDRAIIDSCSAIYLNKINAYSHLSSNIIIHTIPWVLTETGFSPEHFSVFKDNIGGHTVDDILLAEAVKRKLPLISDDKKLLLKARTNSLTFYNSLMMILFLYYKNHIADDLFHQFQNRLFKVAHYSNRIKKYEYSLLEFIKKMK